MKNRVLELIDSPSFPWVIAISAFFLGLYAEIWGDLLKTPYENFFFLRFGSLHWPTAIFSAFTLLWVVAVGIKFYRESANFKRIEVSLFGHNFTRSFPHFTEVLKVFAYLDKKLLSLSGEEKNTQEERDKHRKNIAKEIQNVLKEIASFTAAIAGGSERNYGANVFITMAPHSIEEVKGFHHFFFTKEMEEDQQASLLLMNELRVRPESCDTRQKHKSFIMPVANDEYDGSGRRTALPGAPSAFIRQSLVYYKNIPELIKLTEDFDRKIKDGIVKHFESEHGAEIKSFLSVALVLPGEDEVVGTLNVDSTKDSLLGESEEIRKNYTTLIQILLPMLARAVLEYREAHKNSANTEKN